VGVFALGGFAYYWFVQRHKVGVLADHASVADPLAAAAEEVLTTDAEEATQQ
jgi:hypothetical protein